MSPTADIFSPASELDEHEHGLGNVFDGVLNAYRNDGFEAGYRRATNDLLAEFLLISEEFLRNLDEPSPELRKVLRTFERHLEQSLERAGAADHFVDGGLGI